jgi:hypothetical protein
LPIDHQLLTGLRRYEDVPAGISEEFAQRRLGPRDALALLSTPLGERSSVGWVVCPSLGPEHGNLRRLEALAARKLAAAGFPVLRIRPDAHPSHGVFGEIDLSVRLREVEDAVELLPAEAGVRHVGLLGAMFGGATAAILGERLDVPGIVLIEPVVRGARYVREVMRRHAVAELMAALEEDGSRTAQRLMDELSTAGQVTLQGLRLRRDEYDTIAAVNLVDDLSSFRRRSLLLGISPTGAVSPGLRQLSDRLEALGGDVTVEVLEDPLPAPFGENYYQNVGPLRIDTRLELDQRLTDAVASWAPSIAPADSRARVA